MSRDSNETDNDTQSYLSQSLFQHFLTFNRTEVIALSIKRVSVFTEALQQRLLLHPRHVARVGLEFVPLPRAQPADDLQRQIMAHQAVHCAVVSFHFGPDIPPDESHSGRREDTEGGREQRRHS